MKLHTLVTLTCATAMTLGLTDAATGNILMLDFGTASGAYTGTNSPGHAAGAISTSFVTWNQISGTADGTVNDSLGNTISYDLGRSGTASNSDNEINAFTSQPTNTSAAGGAGIWSTALTTDAIVDITSANRRDPVAVQLGGLAAGTYDAFLVAHYSGNLGVALEVGFLVRFCLKTPDCADDCP